MEDGVKETADLAKCRKKFEEARDLTETARTEQQKDGDYYDGIQLTAEELAALSKRKQPAIVINRIRPAVNGILGVVERGKSEPRAFPRTPKDEESSEVATDVLRYIADYNHFSQIKIRCFKDMLVPGTMAAQVLVQPDMQVKIEQIRWEEFFYDPRSRREDFSDAAYLGIARWMRADDVARLYPDKADDIEAGLSSRTGFGGLTFDDRPSDAGKWASKKDRRLMVVEQYERAGDRWLKCCYIWNAFLAEPKESDYLDDKGLPSCPIVAASAYVDRENNRYGAVRDMRGPQDEVNKRRSKALHYLNTRQLQEAQPGAGFGDVDVARSEAARPDGVIPGGWQVVQQTDQVQGQLELLREAKSEIERLGPNPAILGREGTDSSGRALLARQQSGLVELAILFGLLEDWELRIYRACWARARQYWRQPMWVRVTDDEGSPQFIGLNQPEMGQAAPQVDPQTGMVSLQPQVLGYKNQIAELDVDIILDTQPDAANVQQEQFQDLMRLVGSNPNYAQSVPFEMLLELSSIPHKRELLDKLKGFREQAQQAQAAQAQAQMQMEGAKAEAEVRKLHADASLNEAKANTESLKPQMDAVQMALDAEREAYPPPGSTGAAQFGA